MYAFASIVHSDISDDLTVCFEVLPCFFDNPSTDSIKKILLHPFGNDVLMFRLACVASVSVWFRSKERPRNGILGFGRARNETRAKKSSGL